MDNRKHFKGFEKQVKEAEGKAISRKKAIRYKCLDCCCFSSAEVKACTSYTCPLWTWRTGKQEPPYNKAVSETE